MRLAGWHASYMDEGWPPVRNGFAATFSVSFGDGSPQTFEVAFPSHPEAVDLAAVRLDRLGGPSRADREYRHELYGLVGAVTVASGHAEAAIMRVIRVLDEDDAVFGALAKLGWGQLVDEVSKRVQGDSAREARIRETLTWAQRIRLADHRNGVVHGYWWQHADVGVTYSRFYRTGQSAMVRASPEEIAQLAQDLFRFAARLDAEVLSEWPQARLSRAE